MLITTEFSKRSFHAGWHLCDEIKLSANDLHLLVICRIYEHEASLTSGRFKNLSSVRQQYAVDLPNIFSGRRMDSHIKNELLIEWIANNVVDQWCVETKYHHMSCVDMIYSFADLETATMFKLIFA